MYKEVTIEVEFLLSNKSRCFLYYSTPINIHGGLLDLKEGNRLLTN